jgi:response regulator of citrate/malate metabolism
VKTIGKVLFIDDQDLDSFLHTELLKKLGFAHEVVVKKNGKEAIEYLELDCSLDKTYPSLIFVDLYMPGGNGFDFLQDFEMLDIPEKYKIAIIILSYSEDADDIIKLTKMGKFHFEHKPLDITTMENIFHRYFRHFGYLEI